MNARLFFLLLAACAPPCPVPLSRDQLGAQPVNPEQPMPAPACVLKKHDAIIVLGCPTDECRQQRAEIALRLRDLGYGDVFITTGAAVHNEVVEADALAALLDGTVYRETQAQHTDENIHFSSLIMRARGMHDALVVSEQPGHLVYSALCDSNCCVRAGRLSVFDIADHKVGHYVLDAEIPEEECDYLAASDSFLCINLPARLYCRA